MERKNDYENDDDISEFIKSITPVSIEEKK